MATLRELKGRISSVASSEKITGAMKMISSAKMHKAEQSLKKLQPFRSQIETIIGNLLNTDAQFTSPLLEEREVRRIAIVVMGSDDGLCGAFNVNILKQFLANVNECRSRHGSQLEIDVYAVGAKIAKAVGKLAVPGLRMATVEGVDTKTSGQGVKAFLDLLIGRFMSGAVDEVWVHYMHFQSVSRQRFTADRMLPVAPSNFAGAEAKAGCRPCIFEPSAADIFTSVLPMYLMSTLQEIFTENRAAEQAARVMAMQSANDNAKKLLDELQLEYNKLRQQSITTELLDILGGQVR